MKKAGIIIFAVGLLVTVFTGLNYVSREVVLEAGDLNVTKDVNHGVSWSPLFGGILIVLGVGIFIGGLRRQRKETVNA